MGNGTETGQLIEALNNISLAITRNTEASYDNAAHIGEILEKWLKELSDMANHTPYLDDIKDAIQSLHKEVS